MIKDLDKRKEYWGKNYLAYQQGDSLPHPFEEYINLFHGKTILEIGPGQGRQFHYIWNTVTFVSYCIADISQNVLNDKMYNSCVMAKYLITNYATDDFVYRFDIIHFWYVLHHVRMEEMPVFAEFLRRHLKKGGMIMFNTAYLDYDAGNYVDGGDGIMTTPAHIMDVEAAFSKHFKFIVTDNSKWMNSNGYVVIGITK